MALPEINEQKIKELVVEQNDNKKFFAKLPKEIDFNSKETKELMSKWSNITVDDIEMENAYYREDYNVNIYEFSIHNYFRFAFVERENGSIDVQQLSFVE
ncbi:hypothetical protein [Mammaliicoccus sp. P-M59]|uniref:hypothetical protein n=1 Tax=Mammaliicoccus sp. P-M59 TaxID=2898718 RepID=UPI001EFB0C68|nr:hypothetical protein [Mammaliicoccus sp. P-M59]